MKNEEIGKLLINIATQLMEKRTETYTCPMHTDVKSDKPGKCPKCGMDLIKKS